MKESLCDHHTEFTCDIVRSQPRHLRLNYVFWKDLEGGGQAESLLGLAESVNGVALGRTIAELQALYDRLVWVDSAAEAEAFLGEVRSTQSSGLLLGIASPRVQHVQNLNSVQLHAIDDDVVRQNNHFPSIWPSTLPVDIGVIGQCGGSRYD